MKVFLGGTCNGSKWREYYMEVLDNLDIDYFIPVVENWDKEAQAIEDAEKAESDIRLYVITPKITGFYSIAEAVDDSNKTNEGIKLVFFIVSKFDDGMTFADSRFTSLVKVGNMISGNGGYFFIINDINDVYSFKDKMLSARALWGGN